MAGVTKVVKHHNELETVKSMRDYTEKAETAINKDIAAFKDKHERVEMTLRTEIQTVEKFSDELSKRTQDFSNSIYYHKTVNQRVTNDEEAVVQEYEKYILEKAMPTQRDKSEIAKQIHEKQIELY